MKRLQESRLKETTIGLILIIMLIVSLWNAEPPKPINVDNLTLYPSNYVITIDGKEVGFSAFNGIPYTIKETSRVIVPIRIISENMGYKVDWDQKTKAATVEGGGVNLKVTIGENHAILNGKKVPIDVQDGKVMNTKALLVPALGTARTYVPLRFIVEATGGKVEYELKNGVHYVDIVTGGNQGTGNEDYTGDYGPHIDLTKVKLQGEGELDVRKKGEKNPNNVDFNYGLMDWKPMEPQYKDVENLLKARFGDQKTVKEVMTYLKSGEKLEFKTWSISGQTIGVTSGYGVKSVTVWLK